VRARAPAYDCVLLDLPAGIDAVVRRLLATADRALVLTTDEPTAITDAYALIKVGRAAAAGFAPQLVVNQVASHGIGRRTYEGLLRVCEHFLDLRPELAGILRRDPRVPEAIRQQAPFLTRSPTSPAARDIEALARHVAGTA
jgi:flagellar biosynthesis protein FlhG